MEVIMNRKCLVGLDMMKNQIIINGDVNKKSLADLLRLVIDDLEADGRQIINARHLPDLFRK